MVTYRLLDCFCKAGGSSAGYHWAGFEVTGCDIDPQPHYPFEFIQADALTISFDDFDVITGSPPCQRWSKLKTMVTSKERPDLLTPFRQRLITEAAGKPYIIENVPQAPLINPVILCGSMFPTTRRLRRHRGFETNFPLPNPPEHSHDQQTINVVGNGGNYLLWQALEAMECGWMTSREEISQAIPPRYTEWIGRHLLAWLAEGNAVK